MKYLFRSIFILVVIFSIAQKIYSQESYKCIWRNPERTMMRIFPEAKDYKTITKKISAENLEMIEEKAGKLLPGQKEVFQYYELIGENDESLGYIFASTQKGEYGAIEFVFGMNKENNIIRIYIQRSREKDKEFKKKDFLDLFIGKKIDEIDKIEYVKTIGTLAVVSGLKKELTAFEVLSELRSSEKLFSRQGVLHLGSVATLSDVAWLLPYSA